MQDTQHDPWREGHELARTLHDALLALHIPETELASLTARPDAVGHPRVYVPGLSPASVEKLLNALGPYLGPTFVGRRDAAPIVRDGVV